MACITIVREIKNIHPADIALIKLGSFFKVFGKDACIISKIFKYKIIQGETLTCGFPIKSINKIKAGLENKKINYLIISDNKKSKKEFINLLEIVQISLTFILYDINILREQKLLRKTLSFP